MTGEVSSGFPPFSRLFVIGDKKASEEDYKTTFSKFGKPISITFIKDRAGENKGIVYVQMSRTSEACKAVESANGMCVGNTTRPMKVLIATNKTESISDEDIMAQVTRLFVVVPKTHTEEDVTKTFEKYGAVRKVVTIKDKRNNEPRGLAFVTYVKASDAALAYENCGSEFRPKFADPVSRKRQHEEGDDKHFDRYSDRTGRSDRMGHSGSMGPPMHSQMPMGSRSQMAMPSASARDQGPAEFLANFPHQNQYYLKVRVPKGLTQHQLTRLFNIVPTLEFCKLATNSYSTTDTAIIGYSSASCCTYAKEAFHGFEYPPGCPLDIEYYTEGGRGDGFQEQGSGASMGTGMGGQGASVGGQGAGMGGQGSAMGGQGSGGFGGANNYQQSSQINYVAGNPDEPFAPPDSETKRRLFIVSHPERISTRDLSAMFRKFGNFISVNYIPGKNCGFAKFANADSADRAQKCMHGESYAGNHLKCLDAEDPPPDNKKAKQESRC